ncbi:RE1-silencing transcription factor A-like [Saccostrea echinata]|uniref:RE1-silencing transcription factor A-like n=1 Tax=Saccostrea echinata TaxID=191078 RepID=UPI002A7EFDA4|nr:RE1-silencing transcription factor A-like [Saccostrea echinata]XP_061196868.1 RE1-silencing transcription factor A-like [Saccostrea echinata]
MESQQEISSSPSTQATTVNLHDLQSYLVTFNKEIESSDQNTFEFKAVSAGTNTGEDKTKTEKNEETGGASACRVEDIAEADKVVDMGALSVLGQIQDEDSPQDLQGVDQTNGMVQVQVPMSEVGNSSMIQVISINGKTSYQLVTGNSSSTSLSSSSSTESQAILSADDKSGAEAVLASVSSPCQITNQSTLQMETGDIAGAQLVALQNSADSSQPQLVAVQSDELTPEAVEASQMLIPNITGGEKLPMVTLMPPDGSQGEPMNYFLIVTNNGEKDGTGLKPVTLDMRPLSDLKTEKDDAVEELIDEDGNVRRVIEIAPKFDMHGTHTTLLQCRYCEYTSPKRYLLMRHMKSHSEDKPHKCNICDRGFKTMASLQNHVNTHTGTRPHKCKECESAFTTSGELVRHIRYKHTFEKPHKCTECEYASVELSKLKRHMRSHTGERPYQCMHCNYASPDTYKLKRHLRIHTGEKPYVCDICQARFTQSNSLKAHKLIHSGNKPVFQCDLCPTTCGRRTDLKIHMMKLHTSSTPLQCKKCSETFPDRYSCKIHMKSHEGERCFKCEQCDYAAMSLRHLEAHILTHTGEKPFECDECDATFRQKQLLKRHKGLYHTDETSLGSPAKEGRLIIAKGNTDENRTKTDSIESSLSSDQLIHGSLLTDLKAGRLGNMPKVVIVHPDGSVEEVTTKLHNLAQEKSMEEVMVANKLDDITKDKTMEEAMMHIVGEETQESENSKSGVPEDYTFTVAQTGDRELDGAPIQTYTMISNGSQILRDEGTQATLETDSEQSNESQNNIATLISSQTIQKTADTVLVRSNTDSIPALQDEVSMKIDLPTTLDVNGDSLTFYTSPSIITAQGLSLETLDSCKKRKGLEELGTEVQSKKLCTEEVSKN